MFLPGLLRGLFPMPDNEPKFDELLEMMRKDPTVLQQHRDLIRDKQERIQREMYDHQKQSNYMEALKRQYEQLLPGNPYQQMPPQVPTTGQVTVQLPACANCSKPTANSRMNFCDECITKAFKWHNEEIKKQAEAEARKNGEGLLDEFDKA